MQSPMPIYTSVVTGCGVLRMRSRRTLSAARSQKAARCTAQAFLAGLTSRVHPAGGKHRPSAGFHPHHRPRLRYPAVVQGPPIDGESVARASVASADMIIESKSRRPHIVFVHVWYSIATSAGKRAKLTFAVQRAELLRSGEKQTVESMTAHSVRLFRLPSPVCRSGRPL